MKKFWNKIDTAELLSSLKVGDRIKYCLHIDQKPYKNGKITRIDTEELKSFGETATRIYISKDDMLLLNCMTGYDLPYNELSPRLANYKLFLYRFE